MFMPTPIPDILGIKHFAESQFEDTYSSIRKATRRKERVKDEAWVTHYADDSDIGLRHQPLEGGTGRVVYEMSSDFTSEMVVSLPPTQHGLFFRHYVKGPDDTQFIPSQTMEQTAIAERFLALVNRAQTALRM